MFFYKEEKSLNFNPIKVLMQKVVNNKIYYQEKISIISLI